MQFINEFFESQPTRYATTQNMGAKGMTSVNKLAPITTNILVNK